MNRAESSRLKAVVLDWAGTTVDFGSLAPLESLREVFGLRGVEVCVEEARGPMGIDKKEHIRALLESPAVRERWIEATGAAPLEADVQSLYLDLEPVLLGEARARGALVAGTRELAQELRARCIRIGSTTGYSRAVMEVVVAGAASQGYAPDAVVTPGDVRAGRPAPWMCFRAAEQLDVFPLWHAVKIGDTPADMREGRNAGMWCIGVTASGNEVGLSEEEFAELPPAARDALVSSAAGRLREAGAHLVADGLWSCLPLLEQIDARIARGERPPEGGAP